MSITILEKNVQNAFGEAGLQWICSLPIIVERLADYWSLSNIVPANNMNWNYVAYAIQKNHDHVVLKISSDRTTLESEYIALMHFDGDGAIKLIDRHSECQAILLEQAIPGNTLKENYPAEIEKTITSYARVVKAIASRKSPNFTYVHMSTWCEAIDKIQDERISDHFVNKAKQLKSKLLDSVKHEYLCHGDLHLENIILNKNEWLAIDPKGIIGEMAFEAAAFDLLDNDELKDLSTIESKIISRVNQLSIALGIDSSRLLSWVFLRIIISAQWFVEDKGDPSRMLKLAQYVYPLLK
ncbi:MAG: phosphotransferase [Gammaproteobacteria bacterium]|nr:phosphotransferase [Gammaproteobacteria bacterium]